MAIAGNGPSHEERHVLQRESWHPWHGCQGRQTLALSIGGLEGGPRASFKSGDKALKELARRSGRSGRRLLQGTTRNRCSASVESDRTKPQRLQSEMPISNHCCNRIFALFGLLHGHDPMAALVGDLIFVREAITYQREATRKEPSTYRAN